MKVYSTLLVFAKGGPDGLVLTNTSKDLPHSILTDETEDHLTLAKNIFYGITEIGPQWELHFKQVGVFEITDLLEKEIHIVLSVYLPEIQKLINGFQWTKFSELDIKDYHYELIRYGAIGRV